MAKRNAVELTPEESIRAISAEYAALSRQKSELEKRLVAIKDSLIEAYRNDPGFDFQAITVCENAAKPKFDWGNLTKKGQETLLEQLKSELPTFVTTKTELDIELLFRSAQTNPLVSNTLKVHNVKFVHEATFTVKVVK